MRFMNQQSKDLWKNSSNPFRYRLELLRKNLKLSQMELSQELKINSEDIRQFEIGKKDPSIHQLKRMAKFFSVTVDQLIGFKLE